MILFSSALLNRRSLFILFALFFVAFLFCFFCSSGAYAATTYKIYFHRDFSNVKSVVVTKSTTKISATIKSLYQPKNASGSLAKYSTSKDCHYLYYRNSSGNFKYFVYAKAQSKYPLGSMSVKNCRSQGYSISKMMSLSGISGKKTLHIYLAYKSKAHTYKVNRQATCAQAGQEACSFCKYARAIPATGKHSFKNKKLPTCVNDGLQSCSTCSLTRAIPATGLHVYKTVKKATCVDVGQGKCSTCSLIRSIPATGKHEYKFVSDGSDRHKTKCRTCGLIGSKGLCAPNSNGKCISCSRKLKNGNKIVVDGSNYIATSSSTVSYCGPTSKSVKSIIVPTKINYHGVSYTVNKINSSACAKLKKLEKVSVVANVISVGKKAFYGCKKLKKFVCNSAVLKKIGSKAFKKCKKLKYVFTLSEKIVSLGAKTFDGCVSLKRFTYKSANLSKSILRKACILR